MGSNSENTMMVERQDFDGVLADIAGLAGASMEHGTMPVLLLGRAVLRDYRRWMELRAHMVCPIPGEPHERMPIIQLAAKVEEWQTARDEQKQADCLALLWALPESQREDAKQYNLAGLLTLVADHTKGLREELAKGDAPTLLLSNDARSKAYTFLRKAYDAFDTPQGETTATEIVQRLLGAARLGERTAGELRELDGWWRGVAGRLAVAMGVPRIETRAEFDLWIEKTLGTLEKYREEDIAARELISDMLGWSREAGRDHPHGITGMLYQLHTMIGRLHAAVGVYRDAPAIPKTEAPDNRTALLLDVARTVGKHGIRPEVPSGGVANALRSLVTRCCDRLLARLKEDGRDIDAMPMNLERLIWEVCNGGEAEGEQEAGSAETEGPEA